MATLSLGGASKQISDSAVTRIRAQIVKWGYPNTPAGALDWLLDMARSAVLAAEAAATPATPPEDPDFPPPTPLMQAEAPEGERKTTRKKAAKRGR